MKEFISFEPHQKFHSVLLPLRFFACFALLKYFGVSWMLTLQQMQICPSFFVISQLRLRKETNWVIKIYSFFEVEPQNNFILRQNPVSDLGYENKRKIFRSFKLKEKLISSLSLWLPKKHHTGFTWKSKLFRYTLWKVKNFSETNFQSCTSFTITKVWIQIQHDFLRKKAIQVNLDLRMISTCKFTYICNTFFLEQQIFRFTI